MKVNIKKLTVKNLTVNMPPQDKNNLEVTEILAIVLEAISRQDIPQKIQDEILGYVAVKLGYHAPQGDTAG